MAADSIRYVGEKVIFKDLPTKEVVSECFKRFSELRKSTLKRATNFFIKNLVFNEKGCTVTIQPIAI